VPTQTLAFIDFETTGLSPDNGDRLIEVGVAVLESASLRIVDRYQSLICPGRSVPSFVTQLTGITSSDVRNAPAASRVLQELHSFLGTTPLAAHNASFEKRFLDAEYARVGLARQQELICTMRVARRVYPDAPNHKLGTLVDYARVPRSGRFHRALDDAEMTAGLWAEMRKRVSQDYGLSSVSDEFMQKIQAVPVRGGLRSLAAGYAAEPVPLSGTNNRA
jgi:DNA polymerase-3 subunit epsilon